MALLSEFEFTPKRDKAISFDGWIVSSPVKTLSGSDVIFGQGISIPNRVGDGIFISVSLDTGTGNDEITGLGASEEDSLMGGSGISANKLITGDGNDSVTGGGGSGLNGGNGIDVGLLAAIGAIEIDTGSGNDDVNGIGGSGSFGRGGSGIYLPSDFTVAGIPEGLGSELYTGSGNDNVKGVGADGGSRGGDGIFIEALSTLYTGSGNDTIIGIGSRGSLADGYGIYVGSHAGRSGTLATGAGNDTVNAVEGGFGGFGATSLGDGNDRLMGFGTGFFSGGDGIDQLRFGQGVYSIDTEAQTITYDGVVMNVKEFEFIGGLKGRLFAFADGTLTVDGNGMVQFT